MVGKIEAGGSSLRLTWFSEKRLHFGGGNLTTKYQEH